APNSQNPDGVIAVPDSTPEPGAINEAGHKFPSPFLPPSSGHRSCAQSAPTHYNYLIFNILQRNLHAISKVAHNGIYRHDRHQEQKQGQEQSHPHRFHLSTMPRVASSPLPRRPAPFRTAPRPRSEEHT